MKRSTAYLFLRRAALSAAVLWLAACQSEGVGIPAMKPGDPIAFSARINEGTEVRTRALDTIYINSDRYKMDFYIQLCSDDNSEPEVGTYVVPSGYEGKLDPKDPTQPLSWHDLLAGHTFYAWNLPWKEAGYVPTNEEIEQGIEIEFYNSSEADGYGENTNNAIYENFIGAKSPKHSYKEHGRYVELTFNHLVSKIRIGSFILIEPGGAIQENLKADITFVGMPTKATFYPHPSGDGRPEVVAHKASKDDGVTYFIKNESESDIFYICPEVDFSNIHFKVDLNDKAYQRFETYYGTFDDVEFSRVPGEDYDRPEGDDKKILHAGEMMTLNIVLIPGIGPGLSLIIEGWSTDEMNDSQYHVNQGIYSEAELRQLLDAFLNQKQPGSGGTTQEDIDRLFEMFGRTENGKKYFPLFENVDISGSSSGNIFPVPDGYTLDGMGHTITLKSNRGSNTDFGYAQYYFNIGQAVDVYLTDGAGHSIYIDKNGYIWLYNAERDEYTPTEHHLDPLEAPYKSYDISCETGVVHKSTYYNNNITGS